MLEKLFRLSENGTTTGREILCFLLVSAAVTILAMPLAFSISYGIGLGLITFALLMACARRGREVSVVTWVLAAIFFAEFTRSMIGW